MRRLTPHISPYPDGGFRLIVLLLHTAIILGVVAVFASFL